MSWHIVFLPLTLQYAALFFLTGLEVRDSFRHWLLYRVAQADHERGAALRQLLTKSHESMWQLACFMTSPLLAAHLQHAGQPPLFAAFAPVRRALSACSNLCRAACASTVSLATTRPWALSAAARSLTSVQELAFRVLLLLPSCSFDPFLLNSSLQVWGYGALSVALGAYYMLEKPSGEDEPSHGVRGAFFAWTFALIIRVLPVLIIVLKIQQGGFSWAIAFIPLWCATPPPSVHVLLAYLTSSDCVVGDSMPILGLNYR